MRRILFVEESQRASDLRDKYTVLAGAFPGDNENGCKVKTT